MLCEVPQWTLNLARAYSLRHPLYVATVQKLCQRYGYVTGNNIYRRNETSVQIQYIHFVVHTEETDQKYIIQRHWIGFHLKPATQTHVLVDQF